MWEESETGLQRKIPTGIYPRRSSHAGFNYVVLGLEPRGLGSRKAKCSIHAELSLSSLEECRRDNAGRKGVKGLLLLGHEKEPWGLGQVMVLGTWGGLPAEQGLITRKNQKPDQATEFYFFLPMKQYSDWPGWQRGGRRTVCF